MRNHGLSKTRIYQCWVDMKRRCDSETDENYGGRGITYCERWSKFMNFYNDMNPTYFETGTIDRIDVNGDYTKDNCRWIERSGQARNKRCYSNNELGVACVSEFTNKGVPSLRARVQDPTNGKRVSKTLSLRQYTMDDALRILKSWVIEKHSEFDYGENHGS